MILGDLALRLLRSKAFWAVAGACLVAALVYSYAAPALRQWASGGSAVVQRAGDQQKAIDAALAQVSAKDRAIAALSQQIQREHETAVAALARASALQAQVDQARTRGDELARKVQDLEARRRAQAPIKTLQEAKSVAESYGFKPVLVPAPPR